MADNTEVVLTRDRWGISHVVAPDAEAAFAAQGWATARDRLWQMEWDRRRGLGRWAEVVGPGAVADDAFFRRLGLASSARSSWAALSPPARAMTEAYAAGVNTWLAAGHDLPTEFDAHPAPPDHWEPWHCVLVYQVRHLFMGSLFRKLWRGAVCALASPDLARAMVAAPGSAWATPMVPPGAGRRAEPGATAAEGFAGPAAPDPVTADSVSLLREAARHLGPIHEAEGGSNSWALDGSRTASGKPLLAGDPHRGIEFPNAYHQCHIACPDFDVIGLAFAGVPGFPHFGHNDSVAWCITHGMADDTDVFIETDPVEVDRVETIVVAGTEPVEVNCGRTERGPVVLGPVGEQAPTLAMMWTPLHGHDSTFDCLRPMLQAGSVDEAERAVRQWVVPVNSLLTADVHGAISFRLRGRVIERPAANRWTPVPSDRDHGWAGREPVPFEHLPAWRDPDRGFLITANNRISDDGPFIALDFANSARHDRLVELLAPLTDATVEDMTAIHADTTSRLAAALVPLLVSSSPSTSLGRVALDVLARWNHRLDIDSAGAAVYGVVRRLWSAEVADRAGLVESRAVGGSYPPAAPTSRMLHDGSAILLAGDGWKTVPGLTDEHALRAVLATLIDRAAQELSAGYGPDATTWQWGALHTMLSPHPLAAALDGLDHLHPPVDPCPGDGETIRCGSIQPINGDRASSSSVARYVFDLADWDRSGWVVPHGVSGMRGSGHDLDQRPLWLACELAPMVYSEAAIAAVAIDVDRVDVGGADPGINVGGPEPE